MKNLVALILVATTAQAALGEVHTPQAIRTPQLDFSPATVAHLEKNVHRLKMDPEDASSYCTVFPVTSDGYMLTALHCVRACLVELGKVDEAGNGYLGLKDLVVVHNPENTNAVCAKFQIPALSITGNIKVVATGSALTLYSRQLFHDNSGFMQQLRDRGWDRRSNDFALLKIEVNAPLSCLRMNPGRLIGGQEAWSVGYPIKAKPSDEPELSASRGRLFSRPEDSQTYQGQPTHEDREWIRAQLGAANLIFSNAANTFGQSGGPIVDANGAVIGITSGFASPPESKENAVHELVGTNIANVLRSFPRELSNELIKGNSSCHQ
jgi:hypothetical protein